MELIEYYRVIRRRLWVIAVFIVLAVGAVVVTRLLPDETSYPAAGRIVVHETAQRRVVLQGNEAIIGIPEREAFWADFNQFLYSRQMIEAAAHEMGITPAEAQNRLRPPRAERIGTSQAATIYVAATGEAGPARDMAVRYCDAVLATIDGVWRSRRQAELDGVRMVLEQRQPGLESEITHLEQRRDRLAAGYDGVPPTGVLERLTAELASVEQEMAASEISRGAASARAEALAGRAGEIAARRGPDAVQQAPLDPRVQALQQAILERQIMLDEQLTRRTDQHEEVRAIRATIERLQERLRSLEAAQAPPPASSNEVSTLLLQTQLAAEVETAALGHRLELLQRRTGEIRDRLPDTRADARLDEHMLARLGAAQDNLNLLLDSIDRLDAEGELLHTAPIFETLTEAEPGHVPRGLAAFLGKLVAATATGAFLGVLFILVLHYLDFSFQDEEEAERMLGVPVLAGIPRSDIQSASRDDASSSPPNTDT